jgi:hypothetical protein
VTTVRERPWGADKLVVGPGGKDLKEGRPMEREAVTTDKIERAVEQAVKASAKLEGRVVPEGFVRSKKAERPLAEISRRR